MQRAHEKKKLNKRIVGFLVIVLTMLYLSVTVAIAQNDSTTANTSITYKRDYLSWGDAWAFDNDAWTASNYSSNPGYSVTYYGSTPKVVDKYLL